MAVELLAWGHCECSASVKSSQTRQLQICLKTPHHCELFTELCIPAPSESVEVHWRIGHFTVNLGQSAAQTGNQLSHAK